MKHKKKGSFWKYLIIISVSVLIGFPYFWLLTTSLKESGKIFLFPPQWLPDPVCWQNYADLFIQTNYALYLWNSVKVAVLTTLGTVVVSATAAFATAKLKFPGRNFFFLLFLCAMMLPVEVIAIPLFLGLAKVGLTNTHFSIIVPAFFGTGGAFGMFLMRQFFITVPDELMEAAKIDGCTPLRTFYNIFLPMATSVIYTFVNTWNDYFVPLIFLNSSPLYTSTLALALFTDETGTTWNQLMAAATVSTLPLLVIFFFSQKRFIESLALSGIK
ncbi:MAG: carbohydrate ABC transporter permease [Clostridia bacterium]